MGALAFRVLGPLEVVDAVDGAAVDLGGPKQRAVLAVLLLEPGAVVSVGRIAEVLWGDHPPASAQGTIQAYVSNLRRALDRHHAGAGSTVVTQAPGYRLDVDPGDVDAEELRLLVAEASAGVDDATAAVLLERARRLWRGAAFAEIADSPLVAADLHRLEELRLQATERWADALLAAGRAGEVAAEVPAVLRDHPLRSRLRAAGMLALYRTGRQAEALRLYADGRAVLRDELGAEPEAELRELEDRILRQDPTLDAPAPAPASGEPPPGGAEARLVGRDREVADLLAAWTAADAGRGGLALIAGEAGIGKTRLADAVVARATADGGIVAWGRSYESEGAPAFWPWVEVLRAGLAALPAEDQGAVLRDVGADAGLLVRLLPELAALAPTAAGSVETADEALRFSLYDAVARALRAIAARRPLAVVLDDLHWADAASLRLLRYLVPQVPSMPLLVVVTYCDDGGEGELAEALATLAREPAARRIELGGLDRDAVAQLLASDLGGDPDDDVVREIADRSGGNPFFVGELGRFFAGGAGDERAREVPPGVRDVVGRRIDRLPPGADRLLAAAAVVGREFDLRTAAEVAEVDAGGEEVLALVEAAVDARLLVEASRVGRYRFTHALVRDALVGGLSSARRARMHRRIAEVLAAGPRSGRPEDLAELAFHALEGATAGDASAALDAAIAAATAALSALSFEEAASLCASALRVLARAGTADPERQFTLELALGTARRREGDFTGARTALTAALASARTLAGPDAGDRFAEAALQFSGGAWWGWWSELGLLDADAVAALEEALERLPPGPSARRAEVLARLAIELHFVAGAERRRDDVSAEALSMARPLGGRALTHALAARHVAVWRPGNAGERRVLADEVVATARSSRAAELEAFGHHFLLVAALERGDTAAAAAQLDESRRIVRSLPLPHLVAQVAWSSSMLALVAGRFEEAEALQGEALATTSRWSDAEALRTWSAQLITLRWEQGRGIELAPALRDLVARETINVNWKTGLALVLADAGELDEAAELLDAVAAAGFADVPDDLGRLFNLTVRALVVALLDDGPRAELLLPLLEPHLGDHIVQPTRLVYAGPVSFHVGCLRAVTGDLDGALAALAAAVDDADRAGAPTYRARALLASARVHARRGGTGDPARADELATAAADAARVLGMARVAERAERVRAE